MDAPTTSKIYTVAPPLCPMCQEPAVRDTRSIYTEQGQLQAHRACLLRDVLGGIGHLIAHEYWCLQHNDPDAGLTYRQSARLVDAYSEIVGIS